MKASVACVALCMVVGVYSFKTGAPQRQCEMMRPFHEEFQPQAGKPPFIVSFNKNRINPGDTISVRIIADNGVKLKGYMIQARVGDTPVGEFTSTGSINLLNCGNTFNNTATHKNNIPRARVNLQWTAPNDLSETVTFKYTVVQDFTKFWVGQESSKLAVTNTF